MFASFDFSVIGASLPYLFGQGMVFTLTLTALAASGGIDKAVANAQEYLAEKSLPAKIEVETRTMDEVRQVMGLIDDESFDTSAVSRVMLDNMSLADMTEAVKIIDGKVETEASGNVTLETVHEIGQTGVTFISSGALTHSVVALDISLNISTD